MLKKYLLVGLVLAIIGGISLYAWAFVRGTTSPQGFFHIQGKDDTAEKVIFIEGADTAAEGTPSLNFGIGTTGPEANVQIRANKATSGFTNRDATLLIENANNGGNTQLKLYDADDDSYIVYSHNDLVFEHRTAAAGDIEVMRLTNGNVGIGTTGPAEKLDLGGNSANILFSDYATNHIIQNCDPPGCAPYYSDSGPRIIFGGGTSCDQAGSLTLQAGANYGYTSGDLNLRAGGDNAGGAAGNVFIYGGRSVSTASAGKVIITGGDGVSGAIGNVEISGGRGSSNNGGAVKITGGEGHSSSGGGGNVEIAGGEKSDSYLYTSAGSVFIKAGVDTGTTNNHGEIYFQTDNGADAYATRMRIHSNGTITSACPSACASDERSKANIKDITNALDVVTAMRAVSFNWKESPHMSKARQIGLIGQEMEKILPEVVRTNEWNGIKDYKFIKYGCIVPVLAEAIKELKAEKDAEIEQLKVEIAALKAKLK